MHDCLTLYLLGVYSLGVFLGVNLCDLPISYLLTLGTIFNDAHEFADELFLQKDTERTTFIHLSRYATISGPWSKEWGRNSTT